MQEAGDRHPKVSDGVLIGPSAKILGNISIGKGCMIAAGSLVLKPVETNQIVAGCPARPVGTVSGRTPALAMKQHSSQMRDSFCTFWEDAVKRADAAKA